MSPAAWRAAIAMTAIVAIAAVVSFALYFRDSGVEIVLDKEGRVTLDFADNQVDFADLLDRVLAADDGQSSEKVLAEAQARFPFLEARCVHRVGLLEIGECAVWIGVAAKHRDEAFKACRYIIDEIKVRLPIWKKEHYADGDSGWVNCERCARHGMAHGDARDETPGIAD